MRNPTAILAAFCLVVPFCLCGCALPSGQNEGTEHQAAGGTVFEETISPNEDYVDSESDIVRYTVRVTQGSPDEATVSAESNSAFFTPVSYEVACEGTLSASDVSVRWTTLMGSTEASEDDELAVAVVRVRTADGDTDERKINFVNGGLEMVAEAVAGT